MSLQSNFINGTSLPSLANLFGDGPNLYQPAAAQSVNASTVDVKLGLGASFLGSGDILIGKLEGGLIKKVESAPE